MARQQTTIILRSYTQNELDMLDTVFRPQERDSIGWKNFKIGLDIYKIVWSKIWRGLESGQFDPPPLKILFGWVLNGLQVVQMDVKQVILSHKAVLNLGLEVLGRLWCSEHFDLKTYNCPLLWLCKSKLWDIQKSSHNP